MSVSSIDSFTYGQFVDAFPAMFHRYDDDDKPATLFNIDLKVKTQQLYEDMCMFCNTYQVLDEFTVDGKGVKVYRRVGETLCSWKGLSSKMMNMKVSVGEIYVGERFCCRNGLIRIILSTNNFMMDESVL